MAILPVENRLFAQPSTAAAPAESKPTDAAAKLPKFEVASVRILAPHELDPMLPPLSPRGAHLFYARNMGMVDLIAVAFGIPDSQHMILGEPAWAKRTQYEIHAKPEENVEKDDTQILLCLQQLLQERFHLTYHRETKAVKAYTLVIAKGGPKLTLKPKKDRDSFGGLYPDRLKLHTNMIGLVSNLKYLLKEMVVDETGLEQDKQEYDIDIDFAPMNSTDSDKPSIFTALQQQLGLKLEKRMVSVEMFVIDHVDREPTPN
jgi:uncharacterized protein (TIGR03435 family)